MKLTINKKTLEKFSESGDNGIVNNIKEPNGTITKFMEEQLLIYLLHEISGRPVTTSNWVPKK